MERTSYNSVSEHFTTLSFSDNTSKMSTEVFENLPSVEQLELDKYLKKKIPVTIYLAVLCIVGIVGNIHAFLVYKLRYRPSNHRTFVIWLAIVDFIACACSIPFEIIDIRYSYTFYSVIACKLFRSVNHFASLCSGLILGVIAVERFRKACRPLGRQLSGKEATVACFITICLCIVLSVPSTVLYGPSTKIIPGYPSIIGRDCTVLTRYKGTLIFKAYSFLLLFICTFIFVVCIVTYTFVGRVLYRSSKFRRSAQTSSPKQRLTSLSSCREGVPSSSDGGNGHKRVSANKYQDEESSAGEHVHDNDNVNSPSSPTTASFKLKFGRAFKKHMIFDRSKQITFMFLVATAVSYAGYVPHFVLITIQGLSKGTYTEISASLGWLTSILIRGYFISNATNPLVYCFMDDRFRRECVYLYRKLKNLIFSQHLTFSARRV